MDISVNVTIDFAERVYTLIGKMAQGAAPATEAPAPAPAKVIEVPASATPAPTHAPAKAIEVPASATPAPDVDLMTVRDKVNALIAQGRRADVVALLGEYGATGFSQLSSEQLNDFYQRINAW